MDDVRIINGLVVTDGAAVQRDVAISGGVISDVASPGALGPARREIDATGCWVVPGALDVHFH